MRYPIPLRIAGMGRFLPERVVTAEELAPKINASASWIIEQTGVVQRRWVTTETASEMGAMAAREALMDARCSATDLDLIINASGTPERIIPDGACLLQRQLGLGESGIPSFSVHSTCLGFIQALNIASLVIATAQHRTVLIVASDIGSVGLDYSSNESACLFGDAAVAAVVTRSGEGEASALHHYRFETFGDGSDHCTIPVGTTRHPARQAVTLQDFLFYMDGPKVLKMAYRRIRPWIASLLPDFPRSMQEIDWVVPHQGSLRAIQSCMRLIAAPAEKVIINIQEYGNCIAASIPSALFDGIHSGRIRRGDRVLLVGTGAGFSIGGAVVTY